VRVCVRHVNAIIVVMLRENDDDDNNNVIHVSIVNAARIYSLLSSLGLGSRVTVYIYIFIPCKYASTVYSARLDEHNNVARRIIASVQHASSDVRGRSERAIPLDDTQRTLFLSLQLVSA